MDALITTGKLDGSQLILAKPQTFMNDSGSAVSSLQRFYQVPLENLLVIYDDVDLPFDHLRLRTEGGAGGQKGVRSIIRALGTNEFPRLRIGIGRPPGRMSVSEYVLQDFTDQESQLLDFILETTVDAVLLYIKEGIHQAMTEYNQSPE
jgi:PTH1 family peptidyl-tRNA hydrolase